MLESGERIHDDLVREIAEETGLLVTPEQLSGVYQNLERDIVALVFRCRLESGQLRPSDETSEFRWLSAPECDEFMDAAYAVRLTDALNIEPPPATRSHDGVDLR